MVLYLLFYIEKNNTCDIHDCRQQSKDSRLSPTGRLAATDSTPHIGRKNAVVTVGRSNLKDSSGYLEREKRLEYVARK